MAYSKASKLWDAGAVTAPIGILRKNTLRYNMRLALIDLGTNSVRLDVYDLDENGNYQRLHRDKASIRLGRGLFKDDKLQEDAMLRALEALQNFRIQCESLAVQQIEAVATSAVRSANNGKAFLNRILLETGFSVRCISGKEEAELILSGIKKDDSVKSGVSAFVDIGGGSTEIGIWNSRRVFFLESFPIGVERITQQFLSPKVTAAKVNSLREHLRSSLAEATSKHEIPLIEHMLGSSGTAKCLQHVLETAGKGERIKLKHLEQLTEQMALLDTHGIKEIPGMNPRRADIILAGAVILCEVMAHFKVNVLQYTKYALRDGLLECARDVALQKYL